MIMQYMQLNKNKKNVEETGISSTQAVRVDLSVNRHQLTTKLCII
jgi:hypothetical protein